MEIIDASPQPISPPVKQDFPAIRLDKSWDIKITKNGIKSWKTEASIVGYNSGNVIRKFDVLIYKEENLRIGLRNSSEYYLSFISWPEYDYMNEILRIDNHNYIGPIMDRKSLRGRPMDTLEDSKSECIHLMWESFK